MVLVGGALAVPTVGALSATAGAHVRGSRSQARLFRLGFPPALLVQRTQFRFTFRTQGTGRALVQFKLAPTSGHGQSLSAGNTQVNAGSGNQTAPLQIPKATPPAVYNLVACLGKQCLTAGTPIMVWTGNWSRSNATGPVASLITSSGATTQTIGPGGGTISTSDAQGNSFSLVIPKNSVAMPTAITMTPLASVGGQPGAVGFKAGVQLAPAGMLLLRPAQLTIATAGQVPWASRNWFAAQDNGDDFHLDPTPPDNSGTPPSQLNSEPNTQTVTELDTQGVSDTPPADVAAQQDVTPPDPGAQVAAQIKQILTDARQQILEQNLSGSAERSVDDAAIAQAQHLASQYLNNVVDNELNSAAAKSNDAAAQTAIKDALDWARTAELLGADPNSTDAKVFSKISQLVYNAYARAQNRCAQAHVLTEIGDHIIPDARELAFLGSAYAHTADDLSKLFACAHFRLAFDSAVTETWSSNSGGANGGYDYEYQASVNIDPDPNTFQQWTGTGPGKYATAQGSTHQSFQTGNTTCTETNTLLSGNGNALEVLDFTFPPSSAATDKSITVTLGSTATENYENTDDCGGSPVFATHPTFWADFTDNRYQAGDSELLTGPDSYAVQLTLDPGTGQTYAQKSYSYTNNLQGEQVADSSTITVTHTPQPWQ